MADELDSWCPVCDRQVIPKRISSPTPKPITQEPTQPKKPLSRRRQPGLVHGTGRTQAALEFSTALSSTITTNASTVSTRTTHATTAGARKPSRVDPSPVPLYCSDECRLQDAQSRVSGFSMCYDPQIGPTDVSAPPSTLLRRHQQLSAPDITSVSSLSSSDCSESSSGSPDNLSSAPHYPNQPSSTQHVSQTEQVKNRLAEISKSQRKSAIDPNIWRPYMYGLTSPLIDENGKEILTGRMAEERSKAAYSGHVPFAARSSPGVVSRLNTSDPTTAAVVAAAAASASPTSPVSSTSRSAPADSSMAWQACSSDQDLMAKYCSALSKRSESRMNRFSQSPSTSPSLHPLYKERSLTPENVKLIVPDVKLRTRNHSCTSLPRTAHFTSASSVYSEPSPSHMRRHSSDKGEESQQLFGFARSRARRMSPTAMTATRPGQLLERSYSSPLIPTTLREEDELLYDAVPLPPAVNKIRTSTLEKRVQKIDGVEKEIEVPVSRIIEVPVAPKTLFGPQRVLATPLPASSS